MRCGEDGRNGGGASRCLSALQVVLQNHGNGASLWSLWWLPVSARCRHVSRFDGGRHMSAYGWPNLKGGDCHMA